MFPPTNAETSSSAPLASQLLGRPQCIHYPPQFGLQVYGNYVFGIIGSRHEHPTSSFLYALLHGTSSHHLAEAAEENRDSPMEAKMEAKKEEAPMCNGEKIQGEEAKETPRELLTRDDQLRFKSSKKTERKRGGKKGGKKKRKGRKGRKGGKGGKGGKGKGKKPPTKARVSRKRKIIQPWMRPLRPVRVMRSQRSQKRHQVQALAQLLRRQPRRRQQRGKLVQRTKHSPQLHPDPMPSLQSLQAARGRVRRPARKNLPAKRPAVRPRQKLVEDRA